MFPYISRVLIAHWRKYPGFSLNSLQDSAQPITQQRLHRRYDSISKVETFYRRWSTPLDNQGKINDGSVDTQDVFNLEPRIQNLHLSAQLNAIVTWSLNQYACLQIHTFSSWCWYMTMAAYYDKRANFNWVHRVRRSSVPYARTDSGTS